jgi:hypothetical protein
LIFTLGQVGQGGKDQILISKETIPCTLRKKNIAP